MSSSANKAIIGLEKQNAGIYSSLVAKGIQFDRTIIPEDISDENHLQLLKDENVKLKEISNANKPPLKEKPKEELKEKPKEELKEKQKDLDDENYNEPVKKIDIIVDMDDIKRAFFNGDYDVFESAIKTHPFKFYNASYKYDSDKDGAPDFSAKNLLKGFVRSFDDYRKCFMICFRCWKYQHDTKYKYESFWIVNTNEKISNIIGSIEDDFIFNELTDIDNFISKIKKIPKSESDSEKDIYDDEYTCIGESYVH